MSLAMRLFLCLLAVASAIGAVAIWPIMLAAATTCAATGPAAGWCVIGYLAAAAALSGLFLFAFLYLIQPCLYGDG